MFGERGRFDSGSLARLGLLGLGDEPTIHLDEAARQGLVDVLAHLGLEQVLVVTHDDTFASSANNLIPFGVTL